MVKDDGKWSEVTERDGVWQVMTEWWSALTRWSKMGPMERGTEFGTEVQSEIWYMTLGVVMFETSNKFSLH